MTNTRVTHDDNYVDQEDSDDSHSVFFHDLAHKSGVKPSQMQILKCLQRTE